MSDLPGKAMANRTRFQVLRLMLVLLLGLVPMLLLPPFQLFGGRDGDTAMAHLIIELFAVVISIMVVSVSYHALDRQGESSTNLFVLGFTVVAGCDLIHTVSYAGMPAFITANVPGKSTFFWLAGRTFEALTISLAAARWSPPVSRNAALLLGVAIVGLIVWAGVVHLDAFPELLVAGKGVTPFKSWYEYSLAAVNLAAALVLWKSADHASSARLYLISGSSLAMAMGGLVFAHYQTSSDFTNIGGHLFKLVSYGLMYRAALIFAIREPHALLRESQSRLREREEQISTLADNLPAGMVYQVVEQPDRSKQFVYVSGGVERFGVSADAVLADASLLYGRVLPADLPRLQAAERRSAGEMQALDLVVRIRRGTGEFGFFHLRSQPRRLEDGRCFWDGVAMDVTDREQAIAELSQLNEDLKKSEDRFSLAVSATHEGIYEWDLVTGEAYYSERFRALLGYRALDPLQPTHQYFLGHVHRDELQRFTLRLQLHRVERSLFDGEYRLVTKQGEGRWFRIRAQAVWNDKGVAVRMAGSIKDIHDEKLTRESLRLARDRELQASEEFSRHLIAAQENERRRLANELHDSVGQNLSLISSRSHILSGIDGLPPRALPLVSAILESASLAIAEVRALVGNLRPLHIDELGLTEALHSLLDRVSQASGIEFQCRIDNVDDVLKGSDATHLYRIVQEAATNVVKHSGARTARVVLERDLHAVRLFVGDSGRGVPGGIHPNGAGLGLTTMTERARLLSGELRIDSERNQGTCVRVELPIRPGADDGSGHDVALEQSGQADILSPSRDH